MIGQILGTITLINNFEGSICVLTSAGVGYTIFVGMNFVAHLKCKQTVCLFTETVVKEDSITLYGFESYESQLWFKSFLKVSGVGTKMAMNVIDTFPNQQIISALINQNPVFFQSVSGLGEKVSQRIISELKKEPAKNTKLLGGVSIAIQHYSNSTQNVVNETNIDTQNEIQNLETPNAKTAKNDVKKQKKDSTTKVNINDVISGLTNLGFEYNKAYNPSKLAVENCNTLEDAIVFALKIINE